MRVGAAVMLAGAVVATAAVAWVIAPPTLTEHPPSTTARPSPQSDARSAGRYFLTKQQIDQAIASGTLKRPVRSLLSVPAPLKFGDYQWNAAGVPAGPTWIRIDLDRQLISVFRAGHEIGTAVIVYGGDNKESPVGTLHILAKAKDHRSSLYDADMPYTLRLTDDGVAIHASTVRWGAATHGCIGIPLPFAERLFSASRVGDEVTISRTPRDKTS